MLADAVTSTWRWANSTPRRASSRPAMEPWSPARPSTSWARHTGCSATTPRPSRRIAGQRVSGRPPQPGLGLLRLRQGDRATAETGIRQALAEAERPQDRCRLLPAAVTIRVATKDLDGARDTATELGRIADALGSSAVRAEHALALGELALADADPASALPCLRRPARAWR